MNDLILLVLSFFNLFATHVNSEVVKVETVISEPIVVDQNYIYKLECLKEIRKHESCKLTTYLDPNGKQLCIGYGHKTTEYTTITKGKAEELLEQDFDKRIQKVKERNLDLSYTKQLALAMAMYNLTWNSYLKIEKSPEKWLQYCNYYKGGKKFKSQGLLKRRQYEKRLWEL